MEAKRVGKCSHKRKTTNKSDFILIRKPKENPLLTSFELQKYLTNSGIHRMILLYKFVTILSVVITLIVVLKLHTKLIFYVSTSFTLTHHKYLLISRSENDFYQYICLFYCHIKF